MFELAVGKYAIQVQDGGLPAMYADYVRHAQLSIEHDLKARKGRVAFCAVARAESWPFLVIAQRYSPAGCGFKPGVLLATETDRLFFGAGTQLRAFDLQAPCQLWEDVADVGFWSWAQHDRTVLMSAELELAAWNMEGRKLWTTFVEPPWSYTVRNGFVELDVMGKISEFSLTEGP